MQPERWQKIQELFQLAIEHDSRDRAALLKQGCAGDESLRREVESLIAFHEGADGLIDSPAIEDGLKAFLAGSNAAMAGFRIGPYKIIREIGRGGMGAVYLAERADDQYRKWVAVKLIKRGMDADFIVRRFRNERQILANLEHANIARLIDGGTSVDGRPYLVMEYVEGLPITEYCQAHQLSIHERLTLFRTVCAAVQFAHQNLVVHRDLKPGNILVTADGTPKLLDFGIAKLLDPAVSDSADQTATGLRAMTPEYASPEQIRGASITTATDVYSLGVLLYELLTGQRPYLFKSKDPLEIARAVCEQEPDKPSTAVSDSELQHADSKKQTDLKTDPQAVIQLGKAGSPFGQPDWGAKPAGVVINPKFLRGDLDNIVLMAMRKEPERRYASVGQFADDIRRHLEGLPVIARKDTFAYRSSKFIRRNKVAVAAASLLIISLIAGVVATIWQARIARQQARVATEQRDRARVETAKAERINQFVQDMLGSADRGWSSPNSQKGANPTVADVLNEASLRVETELADQPEVLAGALRTIGGAYEHLGRFDVAEQDLRRSLELNRKLRGENDPEVGWTTNALAEVMTLKGDYASAEPLYNQAFNILHRKNPEAEIPTYWVVANLADLGEFNTAIKGDLSAAEKFLQEALKLGSGLIGNERATLADALANLAQVRAVQGNLEEAERLLRSSIDEYRKLPGTPRWQSSQSLVLLGNLLAVEKRYKEAESMLRQALDVLGGYADNKNPGVANALLSLSRVLYREGQYVEAEKDVNQSIEIFKQAFPEGHLTFAAPFTALGLIMNKTGRSRQAEANLRKGLAIDEGLLPKGNWQIAVARGALGECLTTQKRYAEAEPLLVESYNDLKSAQGEQNPRTLEARARLVSLYEAWGKRDKLATFAPETR